MKKVEINQANLKRYKANLENLMLVVESKNFNPSNWARSNSVSLAFVSVCVQIGFLKKVGKEYSPCFTPNEITMDLTIAFKKAYNAHKYKPTHNHATKETKTIISKNVKKLKQEKVKKIKRKTISDFTTKELLTELSFRGFKGSFRKTENYKI